MEIVLIFIYLLLSLIIFGLYISKSNLVTLMVVLLISFTGYLVKYHY